MERRLAAILSADVVGYSRLMGNDEASTLAALKAHRRELLDPKAAQYHGRTTSLVGDGALMEFASVVDAVSFAVDVQCAMRERNTNCAADGQIWFRIGINVGDIIVEENEIYGDGVNVAARLEGLAEPGGITVARNVFSQVKDKLDLTFECLGEKTVENIREPITVYRVALDEKATALATPVSRTATASGGRRWARVVGAALCGMAAIAVVFWWKPWETNLPPASLEHTLAPVPAELSIAVLPFDTMSGEPELEYFSDGITEDLITGLSRSPDLTVASRTSSFSYEDQQLNVQQVARELGVRYVLEGSVRKAGSTVRIVAQLIDGGTGHHVWAERFDRESSNILELQDSVTRKIIASLSGNEGLIRRTEYRHAWEKAPTALEEYDYYLRGHAIFYRFTKEEMARAREVWREGLEKFPGSGLLRIKIGWTHFQDVAWGWSTDPKGDLAKALQLALDGLADDNLPPTGQWVGHWLMALAHAWHGRDFEQAVSEAEQTFALAPNDAESFIHLSQVPLFAGDFHLADAWIDKAFNLAPQSPGLFSQHVGWSHYLQGRYRKAVDTLEKIGWPHHPRVLWLVASSYQRLGLFAEAKAAAAKMAKHFPSVTRTYLRETLPYKDPATLEGLLNDLKVAGLPE